MSLNFNRISEDSVINIINNLLNLPKIRSIHLEHIKSGFSDEICRCFERNLSKATGLEHLYLDFSSNEMSEYGLLSIGKGL